MKREIRISIVIALLLGVSSSALPQENSKDKATNQSIDKDTVSVKLTVPITDEGLRKLGVRNLKGTDVDRMATILTLLGAARSGGTGGGGLNYTCTSETNTCVCHGWLDCVLAMDECKTPPKEPPGNLCTGTVPCSCQWH